MLDIEDYIKGLTSVGIKYSKFFLELYTPASEGEAIYIYSKDSNHLQVYKDGYIKESNKVFPDDPSKLTKYCPHYCPHEGELLRTKIGKCTHIYWILKEDIDLLKSIYTVDLFNYNLMPIFSNDIGLIGQKIFKSSTLYRLHKVYIKSIQTPPINLRYFFSDSKNLIAMKFLGEKLTRKEYEAFSIFDEYITIQA